MVNCKVSHRGSNYCRGYAFDIFVYLSISIIPIKSNQMNTMNKPLPIMTTAFVNSVPEFRIYYDGVIIRKFSNEDEAKICLARLIDSILKQ